MLNKYNFQLVNCDTDSISFCKSDFSEFTKEEIQKMLEEVNELLPELIILEDDGYFPNFVVVKAKNYIIDDGKKIKFKGSSMTDAKREPRLRKFIEDIGHCLLKNDIDAIDDLYKQAIIDANTVQDITEWATKKTVTKSVLNPERTNEEKILTAIEDTDFNEGDKIWLYYDNDDNLRLIDKWHHDENKKRLTKRVWDTLNIFKDLTDMKKYAKYHLKNKKVQQELEELLS